MPALGVRGFRIFRGLWGDDEFAVSIDAVVNLAQIAEDAAADCDFVAGAEMAEIETVLRYRCDAGSGGCVEPELLERLGKGNARRSDFVGEHHYIALNASRFFACERDFVCKLSFGPAADAVGPAEDGTAGDQQ